MPVFAKRPTVIGHRGFGKGVVDGHRENTLDSLHAAVEAGLDWVEMDVRRTRDDTLVVLHLPTTDDGTWLVELTAREVAALGIPSLDEALEAVPAQVGVNLDVKSSLEDATRPGERTTAALLAPTAAQEADRRRLLVTSFDAAALLLLRERSPSVPIGLLTWIGFPFRKAVPMAAHLALDAIVAHVKSFAVNDIDPAPIHRETDYSVQIAHRAGLEVVAWCPDATTAVRLVEAGVDAVVANDVPGVLAALAVARS